MSFKSMLKDRCDILARTKGTSGKRVTESWATESSNVRCRKITRESTSFDIDTKTTKNASQIRTKFLFLPSASIAIRKRISHGGRVYDVSEVVPAGDSSSTRHQVAICTAVAGGE